MNAATTANFSVDLGFQFRRFLDFEAAPIDRLEEAAGLEPEALQGLLSWSGVPEGDVRMRFRGENFVSRALRNPVMRGCPLCLREDAQADPSHPERVMAMRGDWLLRAVRLCCRHHHPLVPLWDARRPVQRFDSAAHLRDLTPRIVAGEFDLPPQAPSAYDLWLDERLETGADPTWLADHDLFTVTTICDLFGAALLRSQISEGDAGTEQKADPHAAGFAILAQGEEAFKEALRGLALSITGDQIAPRRAFGKLYDALNDYLSDASFDPFRTILRDCIFETWPLPAGETVLGEALPARRLHTPSTAAQEMGVTAPLLTRILTEAGALPEGDPRPPLLRTFDAVNYAGLLKDIPTLVAVPEMRAAMGATRAQFKSLVDADLLTPMTRHPKVRAPWRIADGLALVSELEALAQPCPATEDWEGIQVTSARTGLDLREMIAAIRQGEIQLGQDPDQTGYRSFMLRKSEIDRMAGDRPHARRSAASSPSGQPASVFASSIGVRRKGWFAALYAAGHVSAHWAPHPVTRARILYVTESDMATFHSRFLTPILMQREFGLHRQTCTARLRAAGIQPFSPDGQDFGPLYERKDVEPVLRGTEA